MNPERTGGIIATLIVVAFGVCVALYLHAQSEDTSQATRALEAGGYRNPKIVRSGIAIGWEGCGQDDSIFYKAEVDTPTGRTAVTVCCGGIFKSCTVRVP